MWGLGVLGEAIREGWSQAPLFGLRHRPDYVAANGCPHGAAARRIPVLRRPWPDLPFARRRDYARRACILSREAILRFRVVGRLDRDLSGRTYESYEL